MAKAKIPEPKDVKKMFWLGVGALAVGCLIVAVLDCRMKSPRLDLAGKWRTVWNGR